MSNVKSFIFILCVVGCGEEYQDLIDEMLRQVQKKVSFEKDSSDKGILLGHPDLHRVIKELVKQEREQGGELKFS